MTDGIAVEDHLLAQAMEIARKRIRTEAPPATKKRVHILWAAAKQARDLAASNIIHSAFMALAIEVDLIDRNGRWTGADVLDSVRPFGADDISHTIAWALRG